MRKVFYAVARVGAIPPGSATPVTVGDDDYLLIRAADGSYYATGRLCPHQNEPFDHARMEGHEIVCRLHHLRFDVRDGRCTNAGGYSMQVLDVRIEGDDVLVGRWED
jgi:nitrite reductase/ring-hydroxylating ferredoxin subunit